MWTWGGWPHAVSALYKQSSYYRLLIYTWSWWMYTTVSNITNINTSMETPAWHVVRADNGDNTRQLPSSEEHWTLTPAFRFICVQQTLLNVFVLVCVCAHVHMSIYVCERERERRDGNLFNVLSPNTENIMFAWSAVAYKQRQGYSTACNAPFAPSKIKKAVNSTNKWFFFFFSLSFIHRESVSIDGSMAAHIRDTDSLLAVFVRAPRTLSWSHTGSQTNYWSRLWP